MIDIVSLQPWLQIPLSKNCGNLTASTCTRVSVIESIALIKTERRAKAETLPGSPFSVLGQALAAEGRLMEVADSTR